MVKHLGFSRNFFSAVENERSLLADDKLELIFGLYGYNEAEQAELKELTTLARRRSTWLDYQEMLGDDSLRLFGLEEGAKRISVFESMLIPGLLQLPGYTRVVVSFDPSISQVNVARVVEARRRRQARVEAGDVEFTALLSEAALRQQWGGPGLQVRQLLHIVEQITNLDSVTVRVLPFDRPPGTIAGSSTMMILDFDSEHAPSLIYQEAVRNVEPVEEGDEQHTRLKLAWDEGLGRALSGQESLALIQQIAESIE